MRKARETKSALDKLYISIQNYARCYHSASMGTTQPPLQYSSPTTAFVFDIDGVLVRGKQVLPQAIKAIKKLYHPHTKKPKMPLGFLTNGGGVTEETKAYQLSKWLDVAVNANQVVLSHTPYKSILPRYSDASVLIVGRGRNLVHVAESYGISVDSICTVEDLVVAYPSAVPFYSHSRTENNSTNSNDDNISSETPRKSTTQALQAPIKAIFVFNDPADWYLSLQLVVDTLVGGGMLGRRNEDVPVDTPQVDIYFSNPDLLWANDFPAPRFGQGAFFECVKMLYQKVTGKVLRYKVFGKPNREPYTLMEELLLEQGMELGLIASSHSPSSMFEGEKIHASAKSSSSSNTAPVPFSAIYAVGDNSAADVRGARGAGRPWVSILVRTGVFRGGVGENCPLDPADIVVDDVDCAVDAALHHSRSVLWHSMR